MTEKAVLRRFLAILVTALLVGIILHPSCLASEPTMLWSKTYGGIDSDDASSLVQTSDGGYALTGQTGSYGAGVQDYWLVKVDSSGDLQWNRTYGGSSIDVAYDLTQTLDSGYAITGYTFSYGAGGDAWLVKVDSNGNMQWNNTYGGTGFDLFSNVIQTSDGGLALAGYTDSYGDGYDDFWLVKVDSNGNMQWNNTYGGWNNDLVSDSSSLIQTSDGGYALAGSTGSFGAGGGDFWLVKVDSNGNMQWNNTYGGSGNDYAYSLVQTTNGGYAIAGGTWTYGAGKCDVWLVKTDFNGNMQWNNTYGESDFDDAFSIVQVEDGGYAIAGATNSSSGAGNLDFLLVEVDSTGYMRQKTTYGGWNNEYASSLIYTNDNKYAIAGWTASYGAGDLDFWLLKVAPSTDSVSHNLSVSSAHGSSDPSVGTHSYNSGSLLTCNAPSSVTEGSMIWACTGWSGTGSVSSSGLGWWTTFSIVEDSSITWNWRSIPISGDLFELPAIAIHTDHNLVDRARLTSVYPDQTITVSPGQLFSFDYTYQIWQGSNPNEIDQLLFVCSWTPTWPPPNEYYYGIYSDIPPSSGTSGAGTASFTAPSAPGTYYIWFCFDADYSFEQAANSFPTSLSGLPGAIRVVVQSPNYSLAVTSNYGNPTPTVGSHTYSSGTSVTCSVNSPIVVGDITWSCIGWTGTGSVPPSGSDAITTFVITQDSSITWLWKEPPPPIDYSLAVTSAHGNPTPAVGIHSYSSGSLVTCTVNSQVTIGNTPYTCTGWTGTGSVEPSGTGTSTTFTITQDSSITWNWMPSPVKYSLTVFSAHGTSTPLQGTHSYDSGQVLTCSVPGVVMDDNQIYTCTGWTGTGSVPPSGSDAITTFVITQDSSITWLWKESYPLSNGFVTPTSGNTSTIFNYYVTWFHPSTIAPTASVIIDYVSHDMVLYSGSASNGTYVYSTMLPDEDHSYWFSFDLPTMSYVLGPPTVFSGPTVNPIPLFLSLDVIAAISAIVIITVSVAVYLLRLRHQTHRSVNFLPHVRNPLTDKAIAEDISNMERKLKAFKAKYPELSGIAPATSPEELLNKTRVS